MSEIRPAISYAQLYLLAVFYAEQANWDFEPPCFIRASVSVEPALDGEKVEAHGEVKAGFQFNVEQVAAEFYREKARVKHELVKKLAEKVVANYDGELLC